MVLARSRGDQGLFGPTSCQALGTQFFHLVWALVLGGKHYQFYHG